MSLRGDDACFIYNEEGLRTEEHQTMSAQKVSSTMPQPETMHFLHRRRQRTASAVQNHHTYARDSGGSAFPSREKAAMSLQSPRSLGRLAFAVVALFIAALGVFTAPGLAPRAQAAVV